MEYIVTSEEMRNYDKYTSGKLCVPEIVLMERASIGLADVIADKIGSETTDTCAILFLCGYGNNGGDGICSARILKERGIDSEVLLIGNSAKTTEQNAIQQKAYAAYGGKIKEFDPTLAAGYIKDNKSRRKIIVDALFGVGLSRPLGNEYAVLIDTVNEIDSYTIAVDVPSGVSADGEILKGPAVKADCTVTFGFRKLCHVLYPTAINCGEVILVQMGITEKSIGTSTPGYFALTGIKDIGLPKRTPAANKGTYKKLLVVAGSDKVYGAAFLAAKAAFASGIGMVTIMTHEKNRLVFEQSLPEAIYRFYDDDTSDDELKAMFGESEKWADGILIGPGIGLDKTGSILTGFAINMSDKPVVADADSIRIIAADKTLRDKIAGSEKRQFIFTPHVGEFASLMNTTVGEVKEKLAVLPKQLADSLRITINCKDAVSMIASYDVNECALNLSGNDGMASGGSGDVLSGITAVLLLQMGNAFEAAVQAAYIHGLAGDRAADKVGKRAMTASNIIDELVYFWEA